jgi:hypothetical protein
MKDNHHSSGKQVPKVIGADADFKRSGDEIVCPGCGLHFKFSSPSLATTCPGCNLPGFQFPENVPTCEGCGTRGLCFVVDDVHWKMWVSFLPHVMRRLWESAEAIFVKRIDQFVSKTFSDEEIAAAKSEVERRFQYRFNKDPDCIQIPQFVPIKLELIELFKYWYTKDIEHVLESYVFSMSTSEHFVSWLSDLRCDQISDLLAVDEITRARAEVEEHFRKGLGGGIKFRDERDWDIFFHGTEEQRADLIERIQRAFEVSG